MSVLVAAVTLKCTFEGDMFVRALLNYGKHLIAFCDV